MRPNTLKLLVGKILQDMCIDKDLTFKSFIYSVCAHAHLCHKRVVMWRYVCQRTHRSSLFPLGFWGSNSGHQSWQQTYLCLEPSH